LQELQDEYGASYWVFIAPHDRDVALSIRALHSNMIDGLPVPDEVLLHHLPLDIYFVAKDQTRRPFMDGNAFSVRRLSVQGLPNQI